MSTSVAASPTRRPAPTVPSRPRGPSHYEETLATGLGLFSITLGLAEAIAPRAMGRMAGIGDRPTLVRAFGFRELASGVGILSQRQPLGWVTSRIAGDCLDLAVLGAAWARPDNPHRQRAVVAAASVAAVTALDVLCAALLGQAKASATVKSKSRR